MCAVVKMVVDAENNADFTYEFNVSNLETGHNGFIKCNLLE